MVEIAVVSGSVAIALNFLQTVEMPCIHAGVLADIRTTACCKLNCRSSSGRQDRLIGLKLKVRGSQDKGSVSVQGYVVLRYAVFEDD